MDELLKKLPPPEKAAKPLQAALAQIDPALRDSLVGQIVQAIQRNDLRGAAALSHQLSLRYPKSYGAANLEGALAYFSRQYAAAYVSFQRAVALQPRSGLAYVNLGFTAGAQDRFALAADHFRRATRLEPRYQPAWLYLSDCTARIHHYSESASAARHLTAVAPGYYGGWWELARAENALGHKQEAREAIKHARALLGSRRKR